MENQNQNTQQSQQKAQTTIKPNAPFNQQAEQESDFFDFQAIVRIFLGYWYYFLLSVAVCLTLGVIQIWKTPQAYVMQASLLVKDQKANSSVGLGYAFADIAGVSGLIASNVSNEMLILRSRAVMRGVVAHHGFQYHYYEPRFWRNEELYNMSPIKLIPANAEDAYSRSTSFTVEFIQGDTTQFNYVAADTSFICPFNREVDFPNFGRATMRVNPYMALNYMEHVNPKVVVYVASVEGAIGMYLGGLTCSPPDQKESAALDLTYTSTSPFKAADVLNAVIVEYNRQTIESKNEVLDNSMAFIANRIEVVGKELEEVDDRLEHFKRTEKTVSPISEAEGFLSRSAGQEEKITDLEIQLRLINDLIAEMNRTSDDFIMLPLNVGINNSVLNSQVANYDQELLTYRKLKAASSEKSPTVVDKAAELQSMFSIIKQTTQDVKRSVEMQLSQAQGLVNKNLNRMDEATGNVRTLMSIEREQSVKSELYNYLLQKTEENAILKSMTEPNVRVIDSAWGGGGPVTPNKSRIMLIALLIGLAIPYVVCIVKEVLYTRVRGRSDITSQVTAPIVGEIPKKPKKQADQTVFVEAGANNQISEAFRNLRTNLTFLSVNGHPAQVFSLTSTLSGEGKSYVATNLAMACAILDKKVCLVDIDLRKMSTSRFFHLRGKKGMSEYLAGAITCPIMDLVQETNYTNVWVLPGGVIPPNPAELLSGTKFDEVVDELRKHFDYVILDNPPLDVVSDAGIANRVTDATLYVMRMGHLDRRQLSTVQETYTSGRLKNMALILTDIDYDALNYSIGYTGYGKYYGYRYYGHTYYNYYASYNEGDASSKHSFGLYRRKHKK